MMMRSMKKRQLGEVKVVKDGGVRNAVLFA